MSWADSYLRQVVQTQYEVSVESTATLIADVITELGGAVSAAKTPRVLRQLSGTRPFLVRPAEIFRKLSRLTSPALPNQLRALTSRWSTFRYFWAFSRLAAGSPDRAFRLSKMAREIDPHHKNVLSDDFGIGFAGLVLERLLGAPHHIETSFALLDSANYQGVHRVGSRQPDYLMWGRGSPLYVVECKGSLSSIHTSLWQLSSGLEQVLALDFSRSRRRVRRIVVATLLDVNNTRVLVVDPPKSEKRGKVTSDKISDSPSALIRVVDRDRFEEVAWTSQASSLLRWIGQHEAADNLLEQLHLPTEPGDPRLRNFEVERRETPFGNFRGIVERIPFTRKLSVFRGVHENLFESFSSGSIENISTYWDHIPRESREPMPPNWSIGSDGSCLFIDGVDEEPESD